MEIKKSEQLRGDFKILYTIWNNDRPLESVCSKPLTLFQYPNIHAIPNFFISSDALI